MSGVVVRAAFVDEEGRTRFEEVERDGQRFVRRPGGAGGFISNAEGVRRVLWNLPRLRAHLSNGRRAGPVYLTEGTSDALALKAHLAEHGLPGVVTTNPFGALSWRPEFTELLTGAWEVVVIVDVDDAGRKRAALLRGELEPVVEQLRILHTPLAHKGADLRDHLKAGLGLDALVPVPSPNQQEPQPLPWLERASDLLNEPDPGSTPWLVSDLLVAGCVGAVQGPPKTGKTWAILELALAIVTGRKAFGRFEVPTLGPVILVLEESGRAALHRRLGALSRGDAIRPDELEALHFSANRRVRLDDLEWQQELEAAVRAIRPVAVFLDPLARMKKPERDESAQKEMAPLLDFMRYLRDLIEPAPSVTFCHHEGHAGGHLRGSSDLEGYWESKVTLKREDDIYTLSAEHREAEASAAYSFRQAWDLETRSVRLRLIEDERREELDRQVAAHLLEHPDDSGNDVFKTLGGRKQDVLAAVKRVRAQQTLEGLE